MSATIASGNIGIIPPENPVTLATRLIGPVFADVYTVPAGFTFYVTGYAFAPAAGSGGAEPTVYVDGVLVVDYRAGIDQPISVYGNPIFTAAENQVLRFSDVGSPNDVSMNMWGYLL